MVVDDDEEMLAAMTRQSEEQMWPALPPAPVRSPAPAAALAPNEPPELKPEQLWVPRPPATSPDSNAPGSDLLAPEIDIDSIRDGFWSSAAWNVLESAGSAVAAVALERQM